MIPSSGRPVRASCGAFTHNTATAMASLVALVPLGARIVLPGTEPPTWRTSRSPTMRPAELARSRRRELSPLSADEVKIDGRSSTVSGLHGGEQHQIRDPDASVIPTLP